MSRMFQVHQSFFKAKKMQGLSKAEIDRLFRDVENARAFIKDYASVYQRNLETAHSLISQLPTMRQMQDNINAISRTVGAAGLQYFSLVSSLESSASKYLNDLQKAGRAFKEMQQTINAINGFGFSHLTDIRANHYFVIASLEQLSAVPELKSSFAVELASRIKKVVEEDSDKKQKVIEEFVREEIDKQPNNDAKWAVYTFIITFLMFLTTTPIGITQLYYSRLQYIDSIKQKDAGTLAATPRENDVYYIVERQVQLKQGPSFKGDSLAILYPNQEVKLITKDHKWIYVEYFDYLEGVSKKGWVNKKYLKKIEIMFVSSGTVTDSELEREMNDWQKLGAHSWNMFEYEEQTR